jgi:proteasome lid subunit RPN8/RPN11
MYDGGRLGVQTIEGEGRNPDSLDLYYELCALGGSSEAIRDWLLGELRERETATIETGFGCASPTVRLPYWVIAGHASSFMPAISRLLESKSTQAGVGVHALDSNRRPSGWEWYDVAPFRVFQERGWTIRIAAHIEGEMAQLAAAKAPHETGGYLYGGIDPMEHRITIVRLTGEPPGTRSGPTFLELPPAGTSDEEKKLYHQSAHRLTPVACWHSHPGSSAGMSRKDRATARRFMEENQARGTPTLLLVIGRDGMTVNVC